MEIASATVRLAGDVGMTVTKNAITPAELLILRALHGEDAVVNIQPRHMDKRSHKAEKDRLVGFYDEGKADASKVVDKMFPGVFPRLPVYFADVGVAVKGAKTGDEFDEIAQAAMTEADLFGKPEPATVNT